MRLPTSTQCKTSSHTNGHNDHGYDKLSKPSNPSRGRRVLQHLTSHLYTGYDDAHRLCRGICIRLRRSPGAVGKDFVQYLRGQVWTLRFGLVLLWVCLLWRGEVYLFDKAMADCAWPAWEGWPRGAAPHRVAFVADPQLVDPHTYPGRPWLLSTLTIKHTDLYLQRSYSRIQTDLNPDSVIFLGDMFDGGREWATGTSESPDERYKQFGPAFWQREFQRFGNIFFREYAKDTATKADRKRSDGRKIIASLPGNHDLGFSTGIQFPVRSRHEAWFGEGNRVDILGNHTFVSLDAVSLSALQAKAAPVELHRPAQEFMRNIDAARYGAIARHLHHLYNIPSPDREQERDLIDLDDPDLIWTFSAPPPSLNDTIVPAFNPHPQANIPTILLTHVPLYRPQGTPCGPLRERKPPSIQSPETLDDGNSIPILRGYQYQNTLSPLISWSILSRLGLELTNIFSGDDHDYCEILHEQPFLAGHPLAGVEEGRVKEITVKSISWAMGVRRPGFVLASLLNPVDREGRRLLPDRGDGEDGGTETVHTYLCLLPDQLAIFTRYAVLAGVTVVLMLFRAVNIVGAPGDHHSLPVAAMHKGGRAHQNGVARRQTSTSTSFEPTTPTRSRLSRGDADHDAGSGSSDAEEHKLWRPKPRKSVGAGSTPPHGLAPSPLEGDGEWDDGVRNGSSHDWATRGTRAGRRSRGCAGVLYEWVRGVWSVASIALCWYAILLFW